MRRSNVVPAQQGDLAAERGDTSPSADLFDLGTNSTSINNGERREILKHLEKMEQQASHVKKNIAAEKIKEHDYAKGHARSAKENADFLHGARQLTDQLTMTTAQLESVKNTLKNEIDSLFVKADESGERNDKGDTTELSLAKPLSLSRKKAAGINEAVMKMLLISRDKGADIKQLVQQKAALKAEIKSLADEKKTKEDTLAAYKSETEVRRRSLEVEKSRLASLKASRDGIKNNAAAAKMAMEELEKKCAAQKAATTAALAVQKKELVDSETSLANERSNVQDIEDAIVLAAAREKVILDQLSDYHKLKEQRDGHKAGIATLRAKRSALFTKKEDIGANFAEAKKELEQLLKTIHDLETTMEEEIEPLKAKNDEMQVENAGKESEYKDLLTMLEGFRAMKTKLDDNNEAKLIDQETEHAKKMTEEVEAKRAMIKSQLEEASASLAKIQEEKKAYEAASSEIKKLLDQEMALENEIVALKNVAEAKRAENEGLIAVHRSYEIYRDAVAMLKKTQKIEAELEDDPSYKASYF